ncbi:MAG: 3-hydroxyacyl-CoA dehydrogenase NAD-binding domain-containing protein, partial [Burkholderiales bacterium]
MEFRRIGVAGAGNIGTGVVTDLVLHGICAVVVDVAQDVLARAQAAVLENVRCVPLLSKTLPRITTDEVLQRLVLTTELDELRPCEFIVENVTEDWETKKSLYGRLDR